MIELIEEKELPTRSIVALDTELEANEVPPEVTYKGVAGLLLRRLASPSLLDLTMTEWRECLVLNTPEEEGL
tara:strand:+ start:779 stop:994 length:216 start_codon:yes stop_codon:yes gene_type:complete